MRIKGIVIHGLGNGHKVGMPTANLDIENLTIDIDHGVYGVKVFIYDQQYLGVCSIGNRPTIDNKETIEVHILDFDQDIYGEIIEIEILFKIRDIVKFNNLQEVKNQVNKDIRFLKDSI